MQLKKDQSWLILQKNGAGIGECRGRVQSHWSIYIPQKLLLTGKITYGAHKGTMYEGVILTMAAIRENYWIPKLWQIAKTVIRTARKNIFK